MSLIYDPSRQRTDLEAFFDFVMPFKRIPFFIRTTAFVVALYSIIDLVIIYMGDWDSFMESQMGFWRHILFIAAASFSSSAIFFLHAQFHQLFEQLEKSIDDSQMDQASIEIFFNQQKGLLTSRGWFFIFMGHQWYAVSGFSAPSEGEVLSVFTQFELFGFIQDSFIWFMFVWLIVTYRTSKLPFRVQSGDAHGGLRPLTDLALSGGYIITLLAVINIPVVVVRWDFRGFFWLFGDIFGILIMFVFPFYHIHKTMKSEKRKAVAEMESKLSIVMSSIQGEDKVDSMEELLHFMVYKEMLETTNAMRVWPININVIAKILLSALAPLLTLLIKFYVLPYFVPFIPFLASF